MNHRKSNYNTISSILPYDTLERNLKDTNVFLLSEKAIENMQRNIDDQNQFISTNTRNQVQKSISKIEDNNHTCKLNSNNEISCEFSSMMKNIKKKTSR